MKKLRAILLLSALGLPAAAFAEGSGYFTVTKTAAGPWQLLDPEGHYFFSTGVCVVQPFDSSIPGGGKGYGQGRSEAGLIKQWAAWTAGRLQNWGFNTVGAWSHESMFKQELAYTQSLALLGYDKPQERLVDLWDPAKEAAMQAEARRGTAGKQGDPLLLGYFLDNELPWYGSFGWPGQENTPLLDKYLALPDGAPGKAAALAVMGPRAEKGLAALTAAEAVALRAEFAGKVAERYFALAVKAVKDADPDHMVLGCRFAGPTPDAVVAAARVCDVVSVNSYQKSGRFDQELFDRVHLLTGRPVMLTEFGFRAMENRSGNKNTKGADVTVATQKDRAKHLDRYLGGALELPYLVGYHWFQYFDEPTPGRSFDGEDSNYGLVDIHDLPYAPITAALSRWNRDAARLHAAAAHPVPTSLPQRAAIQVRQRLGEQAGAAAQAKPAGPLGDYGHNAALAWPWNEASASAKAVLDQGELRFDYDSGKAWGCGLGLKAAGSNSDGSADLLGSTGVQLRLRAPKGLRFQVFISESGCGDPALDAHPGVAGADGESYSSPVFVGSGEAQTIAVPWDQLELRQYWGEQRGNRTVDVQAITAVDLSLGGGQGAGSLWIESVDVLP